MKIQNLTVKYSTATIFENFNLEILDGKITCVLGKSGAGKTTLLKCIAGLIPCNYESKKNTSFAFYEDRLIKHLTVKENLTLLGFLPSDIEKWLAKFNVLDKINEYPSKLSSGQKQRVNLARAFLSGSEVCLLDEPFSCLDTPLKLELINTLIKEQNETLKTLVCVTHDIGEALLFADKIVVIDGGKVVYSLDIKSDKQNRENQNFASEKQQILKALSL